MTEFRRASSERVRRLIAETMLARPGGDASRRIGRITLRPHQVDAAERLVAMIQRDGGAMLAEPVGLGKTYTALAVAARLSAERFVVSIPAALRATWIAAMHDCGVDAPIVTHEALSRGAANVDGDFVIVDESHRLRNPKTKRYAAVADLCARARVLLVTATPVQNSAGDLAAQLALFLGRRASTLSDADFARHVVRAARVDASGMPRVDGPHTISLATDDDCVDDILALPPPVPAAGESTAGALLSYGLVHQWTSSRAALVAALERRLARGIALSDALEAGRRPTRAELAAWTWSGDALQLAFPEIVARGEASVTKDVAGWLGAVREHQAAVTSLFDRLRRASDPDDERTDALRAIRRRHPGERVIAFCHYAETVRALWSRLGREPGVAALTASGARVAGGRISRSSVLDQFTPGEGRREAPRAERIDMLIATDVLSEGLNLHEASVVVHLDYPWNPARLDQRVGRVRRLGSRHESVTVYALAPPASSERLLRIEARLRDKLRVAERMVGVAGHILPPLVPHALGRPGAAEVASDVRERLRRWLDYPRRTDEHEDASPPIIAAVASDVDGSIALLLHGGEPQLVADVGNGFDALPSTIRAALSAIHATPCDVADTGIVCVVERLDRWLDSQFGAAAVQLPTVATSGARRVALARVARALSGAPRHKRALLAPLAHAARSAAMTPLAEGAERVLDSLVASDLPDEAWLRSIAAFGELNARRNAPLPEEVRRSRVAAVLLLVRSPA